MAARTSPPRIVLLSIALDRRTTISPQPSTNPFQTSAPDNHHPIDGIKQARSQLVLSNEEDDSSSVEIGVKKASKCLTDYDAERIE